MARKKKQKYGYIFKENFKTFKKQERIDYIKKDVFDNVNFQKHVNKVSMLLDIDKKIVADVLMFYFTKIFHMCDTVSKSTRYINIIGFIKLIIKPENKV